MPCVVVYIRRPDRLDRRPGSRGRTGTPRSAAHRSPPRRTQRSRTRSTPAPPTTRVMKRKSFVQIFFKDRGKNCGVSYSQNFAHMVSYEENIAFMKVTNIVSYISLGKLIFSSRILQTFMQKVL